VAFIVISFYTKLLMNHSSQSLEIGMTCNGCLAQFSFAFARFFGQNMPFVSAVPSELTAPRLFKPFRSGSVGF
jgi:hypothetical protein